MTRSGSQTTVRLSVCNGSVAAAQDKFSSMAAFGGKADDWERTANGFEQPFRSAGIERLLLPKAVVQIGKKQACLLAAIGH